MVAGIDELIHRFCIIDMMDDFGKRISFVEATERWNKLIGCGEQYATTGMTVLVTNRTGVIIKFQMTSVDQSNVEVSRDLLICV